MVKGAFLHDIGHLVGMEGCLDQMVVEGVHLGVEDHDRVGERFLAAAGFPESVTKFVRGHVLAKRYLVFKWAQVSGWYRCALLYDEVPNGLS